MMIAMVIGTLIGALIGAMILAAAADLYNKIAGGPSAPMGVPKMSYGKALGIVILHMAIMGGLNYAVGLAVASADFWTVILVQLGLFRSGSWSWPRW
jgi:hypothetical protein